MNAKFLTLVWKGKIYKTQYIYEGKKKKFMTLWEERKHFPVKIAKRELHQPHSLFHNKKIKIKKGMKETFFYFSMEMGKSTKLTEYL